MLKPDDRLYFIHIPKTAGTTLISLLDSHFGVDEICPAQLWSQMAALPAANVPKYRLYRGHFGGDGLDVLLPRPPVCITMLRHPTALALSTYKFIKREPGIPVNALVRGESMRFEQFVTDPRTRHKITNLQTSSLSFSFRWNPQEGPLAGGRTSRSAVRDWLNARRTHFKPAARLRRAKAKLRECAFFGLVERFEDSMLLLSYAMGWPPPGPVQRLMVSPAGAGPSEMPQATEQAVLARNQLDLRLYSFAERVFERRLTAMRRGLERYASAGDDGLDEAARTRARLDRHYAKCRSRAREERHPRIHVDFDGALHGVGWHRREICDADGSTFRWTGPGATTTIDLLAAGAGDARLTIAILDASGEDVLDGLAVRVNDVPVSLQVIDGEAGPRGRVLQGTIPASALGAGRPFVRLTLDAPRTGTAPGEPVNGPQSRQVGVAVGWIDLRPVSELAPGDVARIELTAEKRQRRSQALREAKVRAVQRGVARLPLIGAPLKDFYQRYKARQSRVEPGRRATCCYDPPMSIVLDARWINDEMSGIGRYTLGLLEGLAEASPGRRIIALGGRADMIEAAAGSRDWLELVPCPSSPTSLADQVRLPRLLRRLNASLFHSPYVYAPLRARGVRVVTTVHDLIPSRFPSGLKRSRKVRHRWMWDAWCRAQYARTSAIITVSDFSKRELAEHAGIDPLRITRIHNGVSRSRLNVAGDLFRGRFGVQGEIVSYVGRRDPYKNLEGLVRAFAVVRKKVGGRVTLVIGGRRDRRYPEPEQLARTMGLSDHVVVTDYLPEDMRVSLIRASTIFVFPSRYEGFGLPPLEAMAEGVPVVASDAASMPEVLGDGAMLVNPDDVDGMGDAIARLLLDADLRRQMADAGRIRAAGFTWRRCAKQHLALYDRVLEHVREPAAAAGPA